MGELLCQRDACFLLLRHEREFVLPARSIYIHKSIGTVTWLTGQWVYTSDRLEGLCINSQTDTTIEKKQL